MNYSDLAILGMLGCLIVACTDELPKAVDYELAHQRAIAAKSINKTSSYNQYSAFASANTGEHVEITGETK